MTGHQHLSDAELVAVIDGADDGALRSRAEGCVECSSRLAELESAASFVGDLLTRDDGVHGALRSEVPRRRSTVPWLIAASLALILLARGPLVAFVNSWRTSEESTVEATPAAATQTYGFEVGDTVVVEFDREHPTSFRAVADSLPRAALRVTGADATDEVVIDGDRVTLSLTGGRPVDVELTIPGGTRTLILHTRDAEIRPMWSPSSTAIPRQWVLSPPG